MQKKASLHSEHKASVIIIIRYHSRRNAMEFWTCYFKLLWGAKNIHFLSLSFPQGFYKIKAIFLHQVWCICHLNYIEILGNALENLVNYCMYHVYTSSYLI